MDVDLGSPSLFEGNGSARAEMSGALQDLGGEDAGLYSDD